MFKFLKPDEYLPRPSAAHSVMFSDFGINDSYVLKPSTFGFIKSKGAPVTQFKVEHLISVGKALPLAFGRHIEGIISGDEKLQCGLEVDINFCSGTIEMQEVKKSPKKVNNIFLKDAPILEIENVEALTPTPKLTAEFVVNNL